MNKVIVDLFSGTGSATKAFRESDEWKVFDVELNERDDVDFDSERIDLEKSIMDVRPEELPDQVDVVWASPPCTTFSTASLGHYWEKGMPDKEKTVNHIGFVYQTLWLINEMQPDYWFLENPRAMLRNVMPFPPAGTVTYCQYGADEQKPTDLYGVHPPSMKYNACPKGANCHDPAPRGENHQGTQAMIKDSVERAKIPYELSKAVKEAVENLEGEVQQTLPEVNASQ